MVKNQQRLVGGSALVQERGAGLRFDWHSSDTSSYPAFIIRYEGRLHAYLNRCPHRGIELDFLPGQLFDTSGEYLICSTHGALFNPHDGSCYAGPCDGKD